MKADHEKLKGFERLHGLRFNEDVKAIIAKNLAMKGELAPRNKTVHALYESEPQPRARDQEEVDAGHFPPIDIMLPVEEIRRRLVRLSLGT